MDHAPRPAAAPLSVHLALVAVQLFFGGFHVASKWALAALPPLPLAAVRVLLATPLLLGSAWRRDRALPPRCTLPKLALLGFLGVFANQLLYVLGLQFTSATSAAILIPSVPAFAAAVAAILGVERVSAGRLLGVGLSICGAVVMLQPARLSLEGGAALGNGLVLLNCLSYAGFLVVQRPLHAELPWRTIVAFAFLFGGAAVTLVGLPGLLRLDLGAVPPSAWLAVGYIVIFPTFLGYGLNTWAVRRSSPVLVAVYTTLQPAFGAALAALILGESVGQRELLGLGLILAGLLQVSRAAR